MTATLDTLRLLAATTRPTRTTLAPHELMATVLDGRYGIEFEPVVAKDDAVLAWRAHARFLDAHGRPADADSVFAALHANPALLLHVEIELKRLAIAAAPAGGALLLPLDADSFTAAGGSESGNPFIALFRAEPRAVVEICENRTLAYPSRVQSLLRALASHDIPVAAGRTTPGTAWCETVAEVDWVSLPCPAAPREPMNLMMLEEAAEAARRAGITAILSSVSTPYHLVLARAIGFAGACGPLFRDCSETAWAGERRASAA